MHKIIYFPVKQTTEGFDLTIKESAYNPKAYSWQLENEHRNALSAAADMISDTDKVIVGDLDEIPNPFLLKKINPADEPVALSMLFHYYFFNCQRIAMDRWWNGSVVTSGKNFKKFAPQIFRDNRNNYTRSKKAGWHFSYLGGAEKIKYKIRSFAHTELDSEEFLQDEHLLKVISNAEDIFKRPGFRFKFVSLYNYPFWLRKQMLDYPLFLSGVFQRSTLKKNWFALKRIFS